MSRNDTGNCLICGNPKSTITYKYCTDCRDRVEYFRKSQRLSVKEATEIIRQEKNIKVVIKKQEPKRDGCPCYWGNRNGVNVVCMFGHCVKGEGFNAGRVRLIRD